MAHRKINSNAKKAPELPTEGDLVAFEHGAAGHEGITSNASGSLIIKPCTQAEIDFYKSAADHEMFAAHIPDFIGVLTLEKEQEALKSFLDQTGGIGPVQTILETATKAFTSAVSGTVSALSPTSLAAKRTSWKPSGGKKLSTGLAIVLENAAAGFQQPNVLDVKLGARLWDDDAPQAKRQKLDDVARETTSGSLGFRIAGMKLWLGDEAAAEASQQFSEENVEIKGGYKCFDKGYGREFNADNVKDAFITYLGGLDNASTSTHSTSKPRLKRKRGELVAKRFIRDLESVQYVLEHQESRMYSASILMVYEGDEEALELALQHEQEQTPELARADTKAAITSAAKEFKNEQLVTGSSAVDNASDEPQDDEDDDDEEDDIPPKVHDVRLIDFAHAKWTPGEGPDENMLQGVRNVIRILKKLVD